MPAEAKKPPTTRQPKVGAAPPPSQESDAAGEERARRWAEEHADTIAAHNAFVAEFGAFGARLRSW